MDLNPFKHGKALKPNSRHEPDIQSKKTPGGEKALSADRIPELTFGSMAVGGKKHPREILASADDTAEKPLRVILTFSSHSIKKQEMEETSYDAVATSD